MCGFRDIRDVRRELSLAEQMALMKLLPATAPALTATPTKTAPTVPLVMHLYRMPDSDAVSSTERHLNSKFDSSLRDFFFLEVRDGHRGRDIHRSVLGRICQVGDSSGRKDHVRNPRP